RSDRDWSSDVCSSDLIPLNQEALEISTRQNYRSLLARAHSNLGMIHAVSGRFKEAFNPMQEALIIARELGSQQDIGLKLNNLGRSEERRVGKECSVRW